MSLCTSDRNRSMHVSSSGSRKSIVPETSACIDAPPRSSFSTSCPIAALTSAGPARYKPLPSVMRSVSHRTGRYPPPATQFPMIAASCEIPLAEITALFLNTRPKSSVSGKTSSCNGRKTPAESTRYRSGSRARSAIV